MRPAVPTLIYRLALLCFLLVQSGCNDNGTSSKASQWQSDFHPVRIKLSDRWEVIRPVKDAADGVTVAIIDNTDGCSLVVKVTPDVSPDVLSDETYFTALRDQMIGNQSGNELIDESEVKFENANFYRMRFTMNNNKFGKLFCQNLYIRRTGALAIICQVSYPIASASKFELPEKMKTLLDGLELFDGSNES